VVNFTPSPGTGDLYANPSFVNPSLGDFSLNSYSQLIGAGQNGYDMGAVPYAVCPLMPTDLEIVSPPNEFTAELSWVNPAQNTDGSTLSSLNGVLIYRNDELIADLYGMVPGASAQHTDTVPIQGSYRYKVLAYTDVNGLYAFTMDQWIGPPVWALPTGPDAYGYTALESVDAGGPTFDWIEIAPAAGGPGVSVSELTGQDDRSSLLPLPFTFQYYGLDYSEITICTNGWLALGDALSDSDWSNSAIPDADGPPGMLAPFWEDMNLETGGEIAFYNDAVNGTFIVEFYRVPQWSPSSALETFEVILHDPATYPTATGDGQILFQWLEVSDPTEATFGIENQAEAVGLQLGLDDNFDPTTIGVQNDYAVLFLPPEDAFPVAVTMTPENPPIIIPAGGGSFNYTVDLSAPTNAETFDVWFDVLLPNGDEYGPLLNRTVTLEPGQSMTRYMEQSVPGNAPAGEYTYRASIGTYNLGVIWSRDQFNFTKSGVNAASIGSWACAESSPGKEVSNFGTRASEYVLHPNTPNPFNPETTIRYTLPEASRVRMEVYNFQGRKVATLANGWRSAGMHEVTFDGSKLASGVYFYRLQAGEFTASGKMVLMK